LGVLRNTSAKTFTSHFGIAVEILAVWGTGQSIMAMIFGV
jgi:hypothetical protein